MVRVAVVLIVFALVLVSNVYEYIYQWSATAVSFDPGLSKIAIADTDDSVNAVYIDVSSYSQRMAAAIFVKHKPIFFGGPTNYGPETTPRALPEGNIAVLREACRSHHAARSYEVVNLPASQIKTRKIPLPLTVSYAGEDNKCLQISGFSSVEAWGRWTDGNSASIGALCECDLSKQKIKMVLKAGTYLIPGKLDRQRAIFRINGSAPQERVLNSMDINDIELDVPPADENPSLLDIKIELPDAASPTIAGAADPRVLGLSIASITLLEGN